MECYRSRTFLTLILVVHQRTIRIRTLPDAANALLTHWDERDGEEYVIAVKECLDAISGESTTEHARAAFIRAAEEAGMGVITLVSPIHTSTRDERTAA